MADLISDPIAGIEFCNKHIRILEETIDKARDAEDFQSATRGEGHLVKWTELLEKFIHQAYQQGKSKSDVTDAFKKKRFSS